jgi:diadenosine tetraphosphate (Ap4A) HIT family hydrolase
MGGAAGASIDHLHLHVIPRYPRETGIADLIAGKRVLVEDPLETTRRLRELAIDRDTIPGADEDAAKDRDHVKSLIACLPPGRQ